ncbi:hypothetical protein [Hyalangium gracile]|uniref:hypothetical protein n=1 Tax=Hyalangium gracile TaxID=394092 RepID=UPI001CCCBF6B|nr:hypothetical protein [Hyalangium gracile]
MALKTGFFSLALGALLLGSTAQADDTQKSQAQQSDAQMQTKGFHGGSEHTYSWGNGDNREYRGAPSRDYSPGGRYYRRTPQPQAPRHQQGRYELKLVQQWVSGGYEQVWVPRECRNYGRRGRVQCTGGYYEQQWVDGHYETVEQWVWVPGRWHHAAPASYWNR